MRRRTRRLPRQKCRELQKLGIPRGEDEIPDEPGRRARGDPASSVDPLPRPSRSRMEDAAHPTSSMSSGKRAGARVCRSTSGEIVHRRAYRAAERTGDAEIRRARSGVKAFCAASAWPGRIDERRCLPQPAGPVRPRRVCRLQRHHRATVDGASLAVEVKRPGQADRRTDRLPRSRIARRRRGVRGVERGRQRGAQ